ncbi:MAG: AAA family ATPase [Desulfobacteraceae bacterium]|nr:AAA family ATPase [Desulfobacteraceae bacterium]MBU4055550.1 AAA family ATPase [Pseudomonadota bacterium]
MRLIHAAGDTLIFADEEIQYSKKGKTTEGPTIPIGAGHKESGMIAQSEGKVGTTATNTAKVIRTMMRDWQVFQFHDTSSNAHIKQSKYVDDSYFLKANAGNLAPFLYQMREHKKKYYQRIVETIRLCAPFFDDFVLIPRDKNVILNWKEKNSDMLFGPHQLSDGTLRMMAIVTLLLQPMLPSMVIIDEPELGLHPYAITVLAGLLKSASERSQLLISTQS